MRNALRALTLLIGGAAALGGCHKSQPKVANNSAMSLDDPTTSNSQAPDNTQFETLPPDESSTTSSRELQNGQDNPDVNVVGNSD